jgi:LacI family transcriptional regulator
MVSIKDVAAKCGVSISTVSKSLNGQKDVSKETSDRICAIATEMGYFPNANARTLKTSRSNNIAILFVDKTKSGLAHEFFSVMINSIKSEAERNGYDIIFSSKNVGDFKMDYYQHAKYRLCDGVIIVSAEFNDKDIIRLIESEIPTITIDHVFNNKTAILSDNVNSLWLLVKYVFDKGHRKIAFIHGEDTSVTQKRIASFYKACASYGLTISNDYVIPAHYHDPKASGLATRKLLELKDRPTCIFYPDDYSFIGGMNEIEKWGLSYPEDISVVGYDGINLSQVLRPRLTTYKQNSETIGKIAAQKLIEMIEKPKMFIPEQIVIEGEILEGDTVKEVR